MRAHRMYCIDLEIQQSYHQIGGPHRQLNALYIAGAKSFPGVLDDLAHHFNKHITSNVMR